MGREREHLREERIGVSDTPPLSPPAPRLLNCVESVILLRDDALAPLPAPTFLDEWQFGVGGDSPRSHSVPIPMVVESLPLPASLSAAAEARGHIKRWLAGGIPADTAAIMLVVSELVTNAVQHGLPPVTLLYGHGDDQTVVIAVGDGREEMPVLTPLDAEHARQLQVRGRGIGLVHGLADRVGWIRRPDGGKYVWAEFRAGSGGVMESSVNARRIE